MEQETLSYPKGLTTVPSDQLNTDEELEVCDGMIYDDGELRPLQRPKSTSIAAYTMLFVHHVSGNRDMLISHNGNSLYYCDTATSTIATYFGTCSVESVDAIGNVLIVSGEDGLHYFIWNGSGYTTLDDLPIPKVDFRMYAVNNAEDYYGVVSGTKMSGFQFWNLDSEDWDGPDLDRRFSISVGWRSSTSCRIKVNDLDDFEDYIVGLYSEAKKKAKEKKLFTNPFLVRYALKLYDGSYYFISNPILMLPSIKHNYRFSLDGVDTCTMEVHGCELQYSYKEKIDFSKYKDVIECVSVFVSQDIPIYQGDNLVKYSKTILLNDKSLHFFIGGYCTNFDGVYYDNSNLLGSNSLGWYHNGITGNEHNGGNAINGWYKDDALTYEIFKSLSDDEVLKNISTTGTFYKLCDLPADTSSASYNSGWKSTVGLFNYKDLENITALEQLQRDNFHDNCKLHAGVIKTYNSRLTLANIERNFFDGFTFFVGCDYTSTSTDLSSSNFSPTGISTRTLTYEVYVDTDEGMFKESVTSSEYGRLGIWFYYPDVRAKYVVVKQGSSILWSATLTPHTALNGAYYIGTLPTDNVEKVSQTTTPPSSYTEDGIEHLASQIVTSEVNNPWIFYADGYNDVPDGEIIGLATTTTALSQGQFGAYPIIIFTSKGCYSMTVGDDGYYSSIKPPFSREVCCNANSITEVDGAVFFISKKGLMRIIGGEVTWVNELYHGGVLTASAEGSSGSTIPYLSGANMSITAAETKVQITVYDPDNFGWTLSGTTSALSFSMSSGSGTKQVTVTVAANIETAEKTHKVLLSSGGKTVDTLTITQAAIEDNGGDTTKRTPYFSYETATATSNETTIQVQVFDPDNVGWYLIKSAYSSALTLSATEGLGNTTLTITVPANSTTSSKEYIVSLESGSSIVDTFTITQDANSGSDNGGGDNGDDETTLPYFLEKIIAVESTATTATFYVANPDGLAWKLVRPYDGTLDTTSGEEEANVTCTFEANTSSEEKLHYCGLKYEGEEVDRLVIRQAAYEEDSNETLPHFSYKSATITCKETTIQVLVLDPNSKGWKTASDGEEKTGTQVYKITVPANETSESKEYTYHLYYDEEEVDTLTITQEGAEIVTTTPSFSTHSIDMGKSGTVYLYVQDPNSVGWTIENTSATGSVTPRSGTGNTKITFAANASLTAVTNTLALLVDGVQVDTCSIYQTSSEKPCIDECEEYVSAEGESIVVAVADEDKVGWNLSYTDPDGNTVSLKSGVGSANVIWTFEANTSEERLTYTLNLTTQTGEALESFAVTQYGASENTKKPSITETYISVDAAGGEFTLTIVDDDNAGWMLFCSSPSINESGTGGKTVTITFPASTTSSTVSYSIRLLDTDGNYLDYVQVVQEACSSQDTMIANLVERLNDGEVFEYSEMSEICAEQYGALVLVAAGETVTAMFDGDTERVKTVTAGTSNEWFFIDAGGSYTDLTQVFGYYNNSGLLRVGWLGVYATTISLSQAFDSCSQLNWINTIGWTPTNVKDWYGMCRDCIALPLFDMSTFTSIGGDLSNMFAGCTNLRKLGLCFDATYVSDVTSIFDGCSNLGTINYNKDGNTALLALGCSLEDGCVLDISETAITDTEQLNYLANGLYDMTQKNKVAELDVNEEQYSVLSGMSAYSSLEAKGWTAVAVASNAKSYKIVAVTTPSQAKPNRISSASSLMTLKTIDIDDFLENCYTAYDYKSSLLMMYEQNTAYFLVYNMRTGAFAWMPSTFKVIGRVNAYPDYYLQGTGNVVYTLLNKPDEEDDANQYAGRVRTRPLKLGSALQLKTLRQLKHLMMMHTTAEINISLYVSNDLHTWVEIESVGGKGYKYYKIEYTFSSLWATDRYTGTALTLDRKQTNILR